jgi:hypothetical protein
MTMRWFDENVIDLVRIRRNRAKQQTALKRGFDSGGWRDFFVGVIAGKTSLNSLCCDPFA